MGGNLLSVRYCSSNVLVSASNKSLLDFLMCSYFCCTCSVTFGFSFPWQDIKLTSLRRSPAEEAADEDDMLGVAVATAQTKIITQIVKKNVIENIVPIVIAIKHMVRQPPWLHVAAAIAQGLLFTFCSISHSVGRAKVGVVEGHHVILKGAHARLQKWNQRSVVFLARRQVIMI